MKISFMFRVIELIVVSGILGGIVCGRFRKWLMFN